VILSSNLSNEELYAEYLLFRTADELKMTGSKVTGTVRGGGGAGADRMKDRG
jgi:hypothetical protein